MSQLVIAPKQEVAKRNVISTDFGTNQNLTVEFNGVLCETPEEKIAAFIAHYQTAIKRKYGIVSRDEKTGEAIKADLIVNGETARIKLPALLEDEDGAALENMYEYYQRTRNKAAGAYTKFMKGLERIDFLPNAI